jgi:5-methylcytosine-specific restriction endonuclease McrA
MKTHRRLSPNERRDILERDAYVCYYCLDEATEVDHILPWAYSFDNDPSNLIASCRRCNITASDLVFSSLEEKRLYIQKHKKRSSSTSRCGNLSILSKAVQARGNRNEYLLQ